MLRLPLVLLYVEGFSMNLDRLEEREIRKAES